MRDYIIEISDRQKVLDEYKQELADLERAMIKESRRDFLSNEIKRLESEIEELKSVAEKK